MQESWTFVLSTNIYYKSVGQSSPASSNFDTMTFRLFYTSNKEAMAGFLPSGKREGLEGVAPSSTSGTPDPPGTRACPQRVGEAERGGELTPTRP